MRERKRGSERERETQRKRARVRSTYNRKQRNLACSDSDFLGLIGEGRGAAEVEKRSGGGGGGATRRRNKDGGWRGDVIERE